MNSKKYIAIMISALCITGCFTGCGNSATMLTTDDKGELGDVCMEEGIGSNKGGVSGSKTDAINGVDGAFDAAEGFGAEGILPGGCVVDDPLGDYDRDDGGYEDAVLEGAPVIDNPGPPVEVETAVDTTTEPTDTTETSETEETEEPTDEIVKPDDKIGMLTAAEWSDHNNWGFFSNLINTGTIEFPSWCSTIGNRVKVTVKNSAGDTLPNEQVTLADRDGNVLYKAVTDKNGIAYLFELNGSSANKVIASDGTEMILPKLQIDTQSGGSKSSDRTAELVIGKDKTAYSNMQIQFIVDTTGSMGDEMLYLQSDFKSIAEEIGVEGKEFSTVFYRDKSDEYIVKASEFTSNVNEIVSALGNEYADGGGDEPEAVAEALDEAFNKVVWREDAVKVAFLIFDAPYHTDESSLETLEKAVRSAAEKGIKVVPVVSSNSNRDTEIFGRALAIATNSTYVFLTDDSGIGESHLEPIVGDYTVEKLHDIIVRIINNYNQGDIA